ncbi:hypothetical protein H112_06505 [Trichophyton rubrum D6]|uniref:Autophagy-related protein 14 n=3 Tax=Trichophyton TaxID=5550 RepID=F2SIJ7_TRIRC|nr:uncharacterized protein TERG_01866 [Trichophyton rubrum CBS 118892]EZF12964.1 hypothetical protein H100_06521 [Trichophyton rubrum MR850]EZF39396.1 hypothetical protein H102_06488 [Trichophyton rubrum CBS 100081]EZF49980.1 hypothetical protein H103_06514 [Trichophyton rubrum CBS 288.86]EZF60630.1 hypothetical protein H104_06496 [Trichophyton rubrum CBS 289.86]EZF71259.1 hypothetical protein H105_06525 [Trichophyton soudanense CBS 452.61]EZF81952.1 hypothetical protein H110_06508 [Trichophy
MGCHVCSQPPSSRLGFYCPTCARNQLYGLRYNHARVLLDKDAAGVQIEASIARNARENAEILSSDGDIPRLSKDVGGAEPEPSRLLMQTKRTAISQSTARMEDIRSHVSTLEKEIADGKKEIARRRAALAQRRSDAESANYEVASRRARALATVQKSIKGKEKQWNSVHEKAVESRAFLSREVASLFGFRQRTRRKKGDFMNQFSIGGVNIVDLRQMNSANPAHITASLENLARMLVLVSHYLGLRLPAEVMVPHRGHPLPAIYTPSSSYMPRRQDSLSSSPNLSPTQSMHNARNAEAMLLPRPRPLFIDRSLPKLAKEDPTGYALFIEGVSLLAWDVSWLCRTQGLHLGSESWEDVCDIGRNLWQLLVAPEPLVKALVSEQANNDANTSANTHEKEGENGLRRTRSLPILGHFSHGSAHTFLGSLEGMEFMKTWKLPSPTKIADRLKSTLLGEMANAEWELLGEEEWEDEGGQGQKADGEGGDKRDVVLLE